MDNFQDELEALVTKYLDTDLPENMIGDLEAEIDRLRDVMVKDKDEDA